MVQHHIDTGGAHPIKVQPRRLTLAYLVAADKQLQEMLNSDIIESFNSLCASLVLMVSKRNKTQMQICVDYIQLTMVTRKNSYPLTRINKSQGLVQNPPGSPLTSLEWVLISPAVSGVTARDSVLHQQRAVANQGTRFLAFVMPHPPSGG